MAKKARSAPPRNPTPPRRTPPSEQEISEAGRTLRAARLGSRSRAAPTAARKTPRRKG